MRYIKSYNNSNAVQQDINNGVLGKPYVALVGNSLDWNTKYNPRQIPLTLEILTAGTFEVINMALNYSINGGSSKQGGQSVVENVEVGDKIVISNPSFGGSSWNASFSGTSTFKAFGNILSLESEYYEYEDTEYGNLAYLFKDSNIVDASELVMPSDFSHSLNCYCMFYGCTGLTSAPVLPATALTESCYNSMFNGCTSLTTAPELPATSLASQCYYGMFGGCSGLSQMPGLPATTLANYCYGSMFEGCAFSWTSTLNAPTLVEGCYNGMFKDCASLSFINCQATDISASDCTYNWVSGVASTGNFAKAEGMTSWTSGVNGIPTGWTVL